MKRYHVISISVLIGLIVGLSVSKAAEAANESCRTLHFTSGAAQYHGEEISTGKDNIPVDEMLCDQGNGTAVLSWSIRGMNQQETLIKSGEGLYTLIAMPENKKQITTVIVYHFAKDGSFNYTKSTNGVAKINGVSMNSVSFALGEWWF